MNNDRPKNNDHALAFAIESSIALSTLAGLSILTSSPIAYSIATTAIAALSTSCAVILAARKIRSSR